MDYFASTVENLAKQASQITMYDVKSTFNKAKAMAFNLSEMETKVNEATNNDPWGASSTVMTEIAQATSDYPLFNEIMPAIYQRFTDKEARQWRQIYKALVLLEYLIKNGSERVIDDARAHLSLIKVLRNFHYTDENGKDQGINVRNRSKEIAELLSDLDRVRQERKKARQNRNKYTGVGNDGSGGGGPSFVSSSGSRFGGFGSESFDRGGGGGGGYSGDRYSGGGGGGGGSSSRSGGFQDSSSRAADYEEYDAGDWDDRAGAAGAGGGTSSFSEPTRSSSTRTSSRQKATPAPPKATPAPPPPAPKAPEVNLFDFDDEEPISSFSPAPAVKAAAPAASLDDDFDDFQSASPPTTSPVAAPSQSSGHQNVFALLNATSPPPVPVQQQPAAPAYSGFAPLQASRPSQPQHSGSYSSFSSQPLQPSSARPTPSTNPSSSGASNGKPAPASDFSDLFSSFGGGGNSSGASASGGMARPASAAQGAGPKLSMAEMAAQARQKQLFEMSGGTPLMPSGASSGGATTQGGNGGGWDSLL